jgi:hypothetical protein
MGLEKMLNPFGFKTRVEGDLLVAEPYDEFVVEPQVNEQARVALDAPADDRVRWTIVVCAPRPLRDTPPVGEVNTFYVTCEETSEVKETVWYRLSTRANDAPLARIIPGDRVRLELRVAFPSSSRGARVDGERVVVAGSFVVPTRFASWNGAGIVSLIIPATVGDTETNLSVSLMFARSDAMEPDSGEPYLLLTHFEAHAAL